MLPVKDITEIVSGITTTVTVGSGVVAYFVARSDAKAKGEKAMNQVNQMATNCFPTMQKNLVEQTGQLTDVLTKSDKQIELLTNIDKSIAVLVDRSVR